MDNTALIVGAGFSKIANLPTTDELGDHFLTLGPTEATPEPLQTAITVALKRFWRDVFGYNGRIPQRPTFEDHFTLLDLAANAGHNLGTIYWPRRLRAIRRLSIHRVFDILDSSFKRDESLVDFLQIMASSKDTAVISTNWDIAVERHLEMRGMACAYGAHIQNPDSVEGSTIGMPLLKLHGSANWTYCDCCRRIYFYPIESGRSALQDWTFLENRDFQCLPGSHKRAVHSMLKSAPAANCSSCNVRLSARVATFSYSKALDYYQYHATWAEARRRLRHCNRWIFIGYSLPEADFQIRHLLKSAQLADKKRSAVQIDVVLRSDGLAAERYRRFFGTGLHRVYADGFHSWWKSQERQ
jgi:hypothetical protein